MRHVTAGGGNARGQESADDAGLLEERGGSRRDSNCCLYHSSVGGTDAGRRFVQDDGDAEDKNREEGRRDPRFAACRMLPFLARGQARRR